jgi:tRNA modification GTPase
VTSLPADTVALCLTPPGAAAIATLGIHGPETWTVAQALFTPRAGSLPETPQESDQGRFWLGRVGAELKDEAVLTLRRVVPVPWVEIHCHGGREVVTMLLEAMSVRGVRLCTWEEWERRTTSSPVRAEANLALARARTVRTAAILLDQSRGALERSLQALLSTLEKGEVTEAKRLLSSLLELATLGQHLTFPWRVVVAGAPNVGKSSLVNALAGFQRSIVSETPGTTRDVVTTLVAIDGWPVELADTAGQREPTEALEEAGIGLARSAAAGADLCLWLVDASTSPEWPGPVQVPVLAVINKIDLPPEWDLDTAREAVRVSARTGSGLAKLCETLSRRLVPAPPASGAAVPFSSEWCDRLEAVGQHLNAGRLKEAAELLREAGPFSP